MLDAKAPNSDALGDLADIPDTTISQSDAYATGKKENILPETGDFEENTGSPVPADI